MRKLILIFLIINCSVHSADISEPELWVCSELGKDGPPIVATLYDSGKYETESLINARGIMHIAHFSIEGFDRRWSFGELTEAGLLEYSFIINLEKIGSYYDFRSACADCKISPTHKLRCDLLVPNKELIRQFFPRRENKPNPFDQFDEE